MLDAPGCRRRLAQMQILNSQRCTRESLINSNFVVPAKAGTQAIQGFLDARLRGHDGFSEVS